MNEEAKSEEQAPAFGPGTKTDDITIDYKPAEKPEQPGKSGEDGEAPARRTRLRTPTAPM